MGAALLGPSVAVVAFWCLLAVGLFSGELDVRRALLFVLIWWGGGMVLGVLGYGAFVPVFVAIVDIVLTLMLFEGDIRLS